jgi:integrase/recombinase XerD
MKLIHNFKGSNRDRLILKFLYATGCRVSELVALTWENCQSCDDGKGKITIHGKGDKTRIILVSAEVWAEVLQMRTDRTLKDAVFPSRTGKALTRSQVNRIVAAAAIDAGID